MKPLAHFLPALMTVALTGVAIAHPYPDIPVWANFSDDGQVKFRIEVDTRVFAEDPDNEPYLQNWAYERFSEEERQAMLEKLATFIDETIKLHIDPVGELDPEFDYRFSKLGGGKLSKTDDPVVLNAEWEMELPENATGYRVEALPGGEFGVKFLNRIDGKAVERTAVLFPGETSYTLDLTKLAAEESEKAQVKEASIQSGPVPMGAALLGAFVLLALYGFARITSRSPQDS